MLKIQANQAKTMYIGSKTSKVQDLLKYFYFFKPQVNFVFYSVENS